MELYQLIYQSQALVPFEPPELQEMLRRARANNQQLRITGIILHTPDGRFLQVLEGDPDTVRDLFYRKIVTDPRHVNCRIVEAGPCEQRRFGAWNMAYRVAQAQHLRTLLAPVPAENPALLVPRPRTLQELLDLLLDFVASPDAPLPPGHPAMAA